MRGEIADAVSVFEANREQTEASAREREALPAEQRRDRAVQWLRERVFHDRVPCDFNPRFYQQTRLEEMPVEMAFWWSQEGLCNHAYAFRNFAFGSQSLPVTLAVWDGGTNCLRPHVDWIRATCQSGRAALVLDTSGIGALTPRSITASRPDAFYGVYHKLADDLLWLDDDLAALRIYDVLRALDMIAQWPGLDASDIRLHAHGMEGVYGRLAAALDDRIRSVEVVEGMRSYADWVTARHYNAENRKSIVLCGMLRYFDLPDLEACDRKNN